MKLLRVISPPVLASLMMGSACFGQHYNQVNLVSSEGTAADSDLKNPWGMSRSSSSPWWIADAGTGLSTLYAGDGTKEGLVVKVPGAKAGSKGTPTGTIYNGNSNIFLLGPSEPSLFLFSTIEGTISGWNPAAGLAKGGSPPSTNAVIAVTGKKGSVYTGLTSAIVEGKTYLYAANAGLGTVDVFGAEFKPVTFTTGPFEPAPFTDDLLPPNYVPYNVQAIGQGIVVTYAYVPPGSSFPTAGMGLGYVDVYWADGQLKLHLEHGDWMNEPWGVALAPTDFGRFSHSLLIGNFADGAGDAADFSGTIAAYDLATGKYEGNLEDTKGKTLAIQGLWAISPGNSSPGNLDTGVIPGTGGKSNYGPAELYFTAGPEGGKQGLFGFLTAVSSEMVAGNDQ
jgi:uncharacterized protein (TIGR03118 family)